ncbi:MAG: hypothetical protein ACR2OU_17110 [Thermomicrobiales bacterium]
MRHARMGHRGRARCGISCCPFSLPMLVAPDQHYRMGQVAASMIGISQQTTNWDLIFASSTIAAIVPLLLVLPLQRVYRQHHGLGHQGLQRNSEGVLGRRGAAALRAPCQQLHRAAAPEQREGLPCMVHVILQTLPQCGGSAMWAAIGEAHLVTAALGTNTLVV